jgi:histone H3/H4
MAKKKMEALVIASKAKAVLKKNKMNVAGDAFDGLNAVIYWYLETAAKRAKANGRKTVRSHDFTI